MLVARLLAPGDLVLVTETGQKMPKMSLVIIFSSVECVEETAIG